MVCDNVSEFLKNLPKRNAFNEEITIVGATKTQTVDTICAAVNAGLSHIGENRVQEFVEKFEFYPNNAHLHFIGHLQTNKLKYIIGKVELIQSCDSLKLANEISALAAKLNVTQNVLLEVNVGREPQKYGFLPEQLMDAYNQVRRLSNIRVAGLMTVLPKTDHLKLRQLCLQMRELYDILKRSEDNIEILSMGMSEDYKLAIECGSNMLRIGRAIFGERA